MNQLRTCPFHFRHVFTEEEYRAILLGRDGTVLPCCSLPRTNFVAVNLETEMIVRDQDGLYILLTLLWAPASRSIPSLVRQLQQTILASGFANPERYLRCATAPRQALLWDSGRCRDASFISKGDARRRRECDSIDGPLKEHSLGRSQSPQGRYDSSQWNSWRHSF